MPGVPGKLAREIHEQLQQDRLRRWRSGERTRRRSTPGRDHRPLRRRQVGGDRRLRGRRLLLRRQPAAADDRQPRRAVPPRGQRRRARRGRLRRARRRLLRRPARRCSTSSRPTACEPTVLFLEADEETLLDRYKETRRRHPLAPDGRIVEGIRAERELLAPLRERADVVMDTSDLTGGDAAAPDRRGAARPRRGPASSP